MADGKAIASEFIWLGALQGGWVRTPTPTSKIALSDARNAVQTPAWFSVKTADVETAKAFLAREVWAICLQIFRTPHRQSNWTPVAMRRGFCFNERMGGLDSNSAHAHPWKISDVVLFPLLFLGLAIDWWLGLSFPIWRPFGLTVGVLIIGVGGWMISRSKRDLDAANQPSLPGEPTTAIVTTGMFSWTRNPNYLGALITGIGASLVFNAPVLLAATLLGAIILDVWMIRPEERYLRNRFGAEYEAYCSHVRRWV